MKKENIPCLNCYMRKRYEKDPKSLISRFWHWHTRYCPGWKRYMHSLSEKERNEMIRKYNLN